MPSLIKKSYLTSRETLKEKLYTALSKIHISINVWSAPNRKYFVAIYAHFVDKSSALRKALLALPYLPRSHGGDEQARELWRVLQEFNTV